MDTGKYFNILYLIIQFHTWNKYFKVTCNCHATTWNNLCFKKYIFYCVFILKIFLASCDKGWCNCAQSLHSSFIKIPPAMAGILRKTTHAVFGSLFSPAFSSAKPVTVCRNWSIITPEVWNLLCKEMFVRSFRNWTVAACAVFSILLKLWLSAIDVRSKQEQSTEYTEEVKRLHESCIVFRCIEFNQSEFDKPIMFVSLTIAHITISSLLLLSVCLVGSITASPCSIWEMRDKLAHSTYSIPRLSLQPGCHISQILTVREWSPSERH